MVINGISVDQYHARQHKVTYGYPERDMSCEWPTGGPNPTFYRNLPGFETVGIEIIVEGSSHNEIRSSIRRLLNLFDAPYVNVSLDGGGNILGTLQNARSQEISINKWHKLTLSLRGIVYRRIVGYVKTSKRRTRRRNTTAVVSMSCSPAEMRSSVRRCWIPSCT